MRTSDAVPSALLAPFERRAYLALIAMVAAFWPVWHWLALRAGDDATDGSALLSIATAATLLWRDGVTTTDARVRWGVPTLLMLLYAASYPFVPFLVRAAIAMSAIAAVCSSLWFDRRMDVRFCGLLLLSLPVIPSLNFYLGYPLRVVVGELTSVLLQLNGFAAVREGTILLWNGHPIAIDAPCSGIRMLWTGLYLTCALAALQRLNARRTALLGAIALAIVMLANVLRATALFYVEAGVVPQARPAHALIGVVVFALAAISIAGAAARLRVAAHAS